MRFTPFLLFDGDCAEAMAFYHSCLGGELTVAKLGDTPMKDQAPVEQHHKVVNAHLKSGDIEFTATDWLHQTRARRYGNSVGVFVSAATYPQLREVFDRLSVGADPELLDELRPLPFGTYGHLVDAYGIQWFFQGHLADEASADAAG